MAGIFASFLYHRELGQRLNKQKPLISTFTEMRGFRLWRDIGIACQFCTKFGMTASTPTFQNVVRIEFHALVRRLHLRLAHSSLYILLLHLHISTNQAVDRNDHRRLGILAP